MRFLYKKDTTGYEDLLEASQEAEGEWTDNKTVQAKNAQVREDNGLKALRDQINALTSVMMKTTKTANKPKGESFPKVKKNGEKNIPKSKGPETSAHGPYKNGQKPIQCYKCGGWGHTVRVCLSLGNQNWRTLNGVENPPEPADPLNQRSKKCFKGGGGQ